MQMISLKRVRWCIEGNAAKGFARLAVLRATPCDWLRTRLCKRQTLAKARMFRAKSSSGTGRREQMKYSDRRKKLKKEIEYQKS